MTTILWTQNTGYSLGTYPERLVVNIPLPVPLSPTTVIYNVISGELPPGLILSGNTIIGNPYIVATQTTYEFCIRASYNNEIADRTFFITITGSNPPEFVIQDTTLDIGPAHQFFAIDKTYVEYKLEATELIPSLRKNLTFSVINGELPAGLSLSKNGLISGIVNVLTPLTPDNIQGIYTFTVSVTDGFLFVTKPYTIYIVGPLYLSADNTYMLDANHLFTADVTSLRPIQWITESNLGTYKSNNYITLPFTLVDITDVVFSINNTDALMLSTIGFIFDNKNAILYGNIPHQSFRTKTYNFTITATRYNYYTGESLTSSKLFTIELEGDINNVITWNNITGSGAILLAELGYANTRGLPQQDQIASIKIIDGGTGYTTIPSIIFIPTNGGVDALAYCTVNNGSIYSVDVIFPGSGYLSAPDIELSQPLGTLDVIQPSTFVVSATSSIPNAVLFYSIYSGSLPPGLELTSDGEIIGKVDKTQLTTFQGTTFDSNTTLVDVVYIFTVQANNQYGTSLQSFSITLDISNTTNYSNIIVKPMMIATQRSLWNDFVNNTTLFPLDSLYRINDKHFGVNQDLTMLIFAGIETSTIDSYINAVMLNNKRKRFLFKNIKTALAIDPLSNNKVYEVVYIEMIDQEELNSAYLPKSFNYNDVTYYANNVINWKLNIAEASSITQNPLTNNQSLLPLWMRSLTKTQIPGFILGLPICYCKVGAASNIVLNINNYINKPSNNFSFNMLDYTIDRYIIDAVTDKSGPQYVIFNNNRTTL